MISQLRIAYIAMNSWEKFMYHFSINGYDYIKGKVGVLET